MVDRINHVWRKSKQVMVKTLVLGMLGVLGLAGCAMAPHEPGTNATNATNATNGANSDLPGSHPGANLPGLPPGAKPLTNYVTVAATEPNTRLLPSTAVDKATSKITRLIFSGLAFLDERGQVKNDIATAIIPNETCTIYDIEIRPDLYFSDGTLVKAGNFARTWSDIVRNADTRREATLLKAVRGYADTARGHEVPSGTMANPGAATNPEGGSVPALTPELEGIEVMSDTHFKVHLERSTCDFISRVATPVFAPLPYAAFDQNGKISASFTENPYGYGPYMLSREGAWERGVQLNLVPNERYLGPRLAKNEGISFKFYRDRDASYRDLQTDELDVDDALPVAALKTYRDQLGARTKEHVSSVTSFLVLPRVARFSPTTDEGRWRRQAISLSLNRAEIARKYFSLMVIPATDFVSPVVLGYDKTRSDNEALRFDLARAKAAWAQANALSPWEGELVLARVDNESSEWVERAASQIRTALGVSVRVVSFPDRAALRKAATEGISPGFGQPVQPSQPVQPGKSGGKNPGSAAGSGQDKTNQGGQPGQPGQPGSLNTPPGALLTPYLVYADSWEPKYPGMNAYLWPLFSAAGIGNDSGYHNPGFEDMLGKARAAVSEYQASHIYHDAETILLRDLPVIPLWFEKTAVGWSTKVAGLHLDWQGIPQYWRITKD